MSFFKNIFKKKGNKLKSNLNIPNLNKRFDYPIKVKQGLIVEDLNNGMVQIPTNSNLYFLRPKEEGRLFIQYQMKALGQGKTSFEFPKSKFETLLVEKKKENVFNKLISKVADYNNVGISLEKQAKLDEAISIYNKCIDLDYPATHAFERLMILFRKKKLYQNEIDVIKKAIKMFSIENERRAKDAYIKNPQIKEKILNGLKENKPVKGLNGMYRFNPYDIKKYVKRLSKTNILLEKNENLDIT